MCMRKHFLHNKIVINFPRQFSSFVMAFRFFIAFNLWNKKEMEWFYYIMQKITISPFYPNFSKNVSKLIPSPGVRGNFRQLQIIEGMSLPVLPNIRSLHACLFLKVYSICFRILGTFLEDFFFYIPTYSLTRSYSQCF